MELYEKKNWMKRRIGIGNDDVPDDSDVTIRLTIKSKQEFLVFRKHPWDRQSVGSGEKKYLFKFLFIRKKLLTENLEYLQEEECV